MDEPLRSPEHDRLDRIEKQISASLAFGWLAARFVTEPESWPIFEAWMRSKPGGGPAENFTRELALMLTDELNIGRQLPRMFGG